LPARSETLEVAGREVTISNPEKVFFPKAGYTKLDLVHFYLAVADGAVHGVDGRPMALKRFVNGAEEAPFFQKRAPEVAAGVDRDRHAELSLRPDRREIVVRDAAQLAGS
jgi:DNA primase